MMRILSISAACYVLASFLAIPTLAGVEVVASKSLTVQPSGPRPGEPGSKYFNIEGKENEKYASFGVLVFEIPKESRDKKVKSVTLTLVQSIPTFAKNGAIRVFLAPDLDDASVLKFDPNASDGVGSQIKRLHALGSGNFKKIDTGKTEFFPLTMDEMVRERITKGGKLCLVIVPADTTVAATYFGTGEQSSGNRPRLILDVP
jgi:hypothetical protein